MTGAGGPSGVPDGLRDALAGRYAIERELGRGGMAVVYLARDLRYDRLVALKVLLGEHTPAGPERFEREIRFAARLQHPHILTVHDSGESRGTGGADPWLWYTMPFVEGESLRDRLRRERQLPVEDALRITTEAARALDYAHQHGVEGDAASINELGQIGGSDGVRPFLWNPEVGTFRRYDLGVPDESVPIAVGVTDLNNTGEATGLGNGSIAFVWTIPIRARLDVVPGSAANTVKRDGRGTVTVAILGSRWFRATDVNPATLTLGNDDGIETPVARRSSGYNVKLADIDKDGLKDLVAEFDKRQLMNNGDLPLDARTLVLLGRMGDGGHIRGVDAVQVTR